MADEEFNEYQLPSDDQESGSSSDEEIIQGDI